MEELHTIFEKQPPFEALAMVYSPKQRWGETYDVNVALERGTLFPELDLPFLAYLEGENEK